MSNKIIKPPSTSTSHAPVLSYVGYKTKIKFDGSCLKQDKITFTHGKTVNIWIAYEINLWNYVDSCDSTQASSLCGAFN